MQVHKTRCLSVSPESTLENSPGKIWPAKSLPAEKTLNFPSRSILHNLVHPVEMLSNWYSSVIFWTSSRWILILSGWYHSYRPCCLLGSHQINAIRSYFFPKYWFNFLGYDIFIFIRFYQLFMLSWEL